MELESARDEGLIRRDLIDAEFSQIRMVSQGNSVTAFVDGVAIATLPGAAEVSSASIFSDSPIAVDMVRVTAI
jgi:hypothetical protein